ncbi:MAG: pseudouridine synthase [Pseudomonadales bacterium]|nr:pseudouridine synthase [Pseudomonadales bacterium]
MNIQSQIKPDILYFDEDIVVTNKPANRLSVPGRDPTLPPSMYTLTSDSFGELHVVHRLDCETSGIMVFARNKEALRNLSKQFHDRVTRKRYIAEVYGDPLKAAGTIEIPLICDWPFRPRQKVDYVYGKYACTLYRKIKPGYAGARLELTPVTGRSHQLRVHMRMLGHPILGDALYAHPAAKVQAPRLYLHASQLEFTHPTNGTLQRFECAAPF